MKKLFPWITILPVFLSSCYRVNTDPSPLFDEVQQEVLARTGQNISWERHSDSFSIEECINAYLDEPLTLEHAIVLALLNNRQLQATFENLGIAKAQLVQAGLLRNPIFSFSYRFSTKSKVSDLIDMTLLQNFLEILLIPLKKRMAESEIEATKAMVSAQVLEIIAQTKIAFYSLQAQEQIWEFKKLFVLGAECSYEMAKRQFEAGNTRELDLVEKRAFYEQSKVSLANAEVEVLKTREKLHVLMGLWGSQIGWKAESLLPIVEEKEQECSDIENRAIANSLDLEIAKKQIYATAAGFGLDTTRIVLPRMDLGPSAEREESVWYVGPAMVLGIPLFDFGQAVSSAAKAEIMRQWNLYTATAIEIRSAARMARVRLLNAHRKTLYYQKVLIPLAEKRTSLTLQQHNAMQIGVFQLLEIKLSEIDQKVQAVEMKRDYWIAHAELELLLNGHLLGKNILETPIKNEIRK
jgi:outer membrane protein, heavy metal efflux system